MSELNFCHQKLCTPENVDTKSPDCSSCSTFASQNFCHQKLCTPENVDTKSPDCSSCSTFASQNFCHQKLCTPEKADTKSPDCSSHVTFASQKFCLLLAVLLVEPGHIKMRALQDHAAIQLHHHVLQKQPPIWFSYHTQRGNMDCANIWGVWKKESGEERKQGKTVKSS